MWCAIAIIFLLLLRIEMMHVIYPMRNLLVEAPSLSTWVEHDPCTTAVPVAISPFCFKRPFQKPSRSCFFQASFSAFFFWNWRKESWKGKPGTRKRDRVLLCMYVGDYVSNGHHHSCFSTVIFGEIAGERACSTNDKELSGYICYWR